MAVPDYRRAMQQAAEDGDDVAVQSAEQSIAAQTENLVKFEQSEREEWMMKLDVEYISACTDVDELYKIETTMDEEGFVGLKNAAEHRLTQLVKKNESKVDVDALFADLDEWTMVASEQDAELVKASQDAAGGADSGVNPIRKGLMVKPAEPEHKPIPKIDLENKKRPSDKFGDSSARHTYDNYQDKWDKWDNANFIEEVTAEEEERERQEDAEKKQRDENEAKVAKASVSDAVRR